MSVAPDILADLANFDTTFCPATSRQLQLDDLADGTYDLEVLSTDLNRTEKNKKIILRWNMLVIDGPSNKGAIIEFVHPLEDNEQVGRLGRDLAILGVKTDEWVEGGGKHFSAEIGQVLPKLPGSIFVGKKRTWDAPARGGAAGRKVAFLDFLRLVSAGTGKASQKVPEKPVAKQPKNVPF